MTAPAPGRNIDKQVKEARDQDAIASTLTCFAVLRNVLHPQADDDGQFRRQEAVFRQKSIAPEDAEKGRYIIYAKSADTHLVAATTRN